MEPWAFNPIDEGKTFWLILATSPLLVAPGSSCASASRSARSGLLLGVAGEATIGVNVYRPRRNVKDWSNHGRLLAASVYTRLQKDSHLALQPAKTAILTIEIVEPAAPERFAALLFGRLGARGASPPLWYDSR